MYTVGYSIRHRELAERAAPQDFVGFQTKKPVCSLAVARGVEADCSYSAGLVVFVCYSWFFVDVCIAAERNAAV